MRFPDQCPFCHHVRNGEGICQCPEDCPSCGQGCCGQVLVDYLRRVHYAAS